ncbi:MAG: hypothetical protein ACRD4C_08865 [Candidatus Acidiferrales bacterium]
MKNSRIFACVALLAAIAFPCAPARAQMSPSAPVVVRNASGAASAQAAWLHAKVIRADRHSIMVQEQGNGRMVHTFTYSQRLQPQMQKIMDAGGYQYGDKVRILCVHGQTVALKIRGKPSKAL